MSLLEILFEFNTYAQGNPVIHMILYVQDHSGI